MIQEKFKNLGIGVVEVIGIATSFLFVTGVIYYYGYYAVGLNADWIINLLTTKELLISNLRLGAGAIMAFLYLSSVFDKSVVNENNKHYNELALGLGVLSVLVVMSYINGKNWFEYLGYLFIFISIYGLLYFKPFGKLISILVIVFVVPFCNGLTALEYKMKSNLPVVTLKEDQKNWLLFDTFSDKFVLIDSKENYRNIRVVSSDDIENIKSK